MMQMQSIFLSPTPPAPVLLMSMCTLQSGGECMILPFVLAEDVPKLFLEFKVGDVHVYTLRSVVIISYP